MLLGQSVLPCVSGVPGRVRGRQGPGFGGSRLGQAGLNVQQPRRLMLLRRLAGRGVPRGQLQLSTQSSTRDAVTVAEVEAAHLRASAFRPPAEAALCQPSTSGPSLSFSSSGMLGGWARRAHQHGSGSGRSLQLRSQLHSGPSAGQQTRSYHEPYREPAQAQAQQGQLQQRLGSGGSAGGSGVGSGTWGAGGPRACPPPRLPQSMAHQRGTGSGGQAATHTTGQGAGYGSQHLGGGSQGATHTGGGRPRQATAAGTVSNAGGLRTPLAQLGVAKYRRAQDEARRRAEEAAGLLRPASRSPIATAVPGQPAAVSATASNNARPGGPAASPGAWAGAPPPATAGEATLAPRASSGTALRSSSSAAAAPIPAAAAPEAAPLQPRSHAAGGSPSNGTLPLTQSEDVPLNGDTLVTQNGSSPPMPAPWPPATDGRQPGAFDEALPLAADSGAADLAAAEASSALHAEAPAAAPAKRTRAKRQPASTAAKRKAAKQTAAAAQQQVSLVADSSSAAPAALAAATEPQVEQPELANQPAGLSLEPAEPALEPAAAETAAAEAAAAPAEAPLPPPDVCVVDTPEEACRVAQLLATRFRGRTWACDTEVANIDVTKESPCGHGTVTCFSVYGGDDIDFGTGSSAGAGAGAPRQTMLWVDTMLTGNGDPAEQDTISAIWAAFKPFFEDASVPKIWHNYSFDRHVLRNAGIDCAGFGGDTMHMARLWDSSRQGKGYSLESLTGDGKLMGKAAGEQRGKVSMKKLFGRPNVKKDGKPGKLLVVPPVVELQRDAQFRGDWIGYSAHDAKSTHQLYAALRQQLEGMACQQDGSMKETGARVPGTMWELYCQTWLPFGELLTEMEKEGMLVDRPHLAAAEVRARADQAAACQRFLAWAARRVPAAGAMNVSSGAQIRQLLFAGAHNQKPEKGTLELERVFKVPNTEGYVEPERAGKAPKKQRDMALWGLWGRGQPSPLVPEVFTASGWPAVSTPVLRALAGKPGVARRALDALDHTAADSSEDEVSVAAMMEDENVQRLAAGAIAEDDGAAAAGLEGSVLGSMEATADEGEWPVDDVLPADQAQADARLAALQAEADAAGYGRFYAAFGGGREGLEACAAVDALCEVGAIDTLLSNFIVPLQGDAIATPDGRVHCSLNINTETGRLSARRPNLQNQPALEKDRYKVRKAFTADVGAGRTLIVADYGQLELRLLAHMANCVSMLTAFELGGDFHSRTALGMYDHIQAAVAGGSCLLEWDGGPEGGKPPVPLLKDMFASERRKAKVLNFSIAYGKTAHGLARDWKTSVDEAQATVDRWYSDRPEVLQWQKVQRAEATGSGTVRTLMGRVRRLPNAMRTADSSNAARGHAMRAAINTPIQGSAADVAMAAMITIQRNERLRAMGWRMLLQVHDEVILEGPKESAQEALALVVACMERPFNGRNPLRVALAVDADTADTWYEAK